MLLTLITLDVYGPVFSNLKMLLRKFQKRYLNNFFTKRISLISILCTLFLKKTERQIKNGTMAQLGYSESNGNMLLYKTFKNYITTLLILVMSENRKRNVPNKCTMERHNESLLFLVTSQERKTIADSLMTFTSVIECSHVSCIHVQRNAVCVVLGQTFLCIV